MPRHAVRLLAVGERLLYVTRPLVARPSLLAALGAIVLALGVFSMIVDPGFFRLAILPLLPVLGASAGRLLHAPVVFVTDRRVVSASRWLRPRSIDLPRVRGVRVRQTALERLVGPGAVAVLVQPIEDVREGVFLCCDFAALPDPQALASAICAAVAGSGSHG